MSHIQIENKNYINKLIETVKFSTDKYGEVVIFTNGNDWYIPTLINNLLKSMKIYEPDRKIAVFCSDMDGYAKCDELGFENFEFINIPDLEVDKITGNSACDTKDYTRLCFVKIVLMKHILDLGYTPLYLDPDMAFIKPGINDLLSYLDTNDFVAAGSATYMNSNIMIARPCEYTLELYRLTKTDYNNILDNKITTGDEDLLRPRLKHDITSYINTDEYPAGCDAERKVNTARIIHSNCVVGLQNKINLMKKCHAWFLYKEVFPVDKYMPPVLNIFPPLLQGDLIEKHFSGYVQRKKPVMRRKYINIAWTNLYCNEQFKGVPFDHVGLQKDLDSLDPNGRYFTLFQYAGKIRERVPKDTIIFGGSEGTYPLPLLYQNDEVFNMKQKTWSEKSVFCSFVGQHSHNVRQMVKNYVDSKNDYFYYKHSGGQCTKTDTDMFIMNIIDSKFCLSPRGFGRSSFRFFEIVKLGSVPIYIWDDVNWLPFQDRIDYDKLGIVLHISLLYLLDDILRSITKEQYETMIAYGKKVVHMFTFEGACEEIVRKINVI